MEEVMDWTFARRMNIALLIFIGIIGAGVAAYYFIFPRCTFISFYRSNGGRVTFSRTGVSFDPAPDHYASNGFDHIEPYVSRLLVPVNRFKFLQMFTPDGTRGFGLHAEDGMVYADLSVEWRQEPRREADIRAFFSSLGTAPSGDYLSGNGGVPDATRSLEYPVTGSAAEVTAMTKRILQELWGVSPAEALNIGYKEK
jgi:hypothetical protein